MKPTDEQQAVLDCDARVLMINARAGTGKTTTLRMMASAHRENRILYLVFNKKAQKEASLKLPRHVLVKTIHSLAYSGKHNRWKDQVGDFTISDMLPAFKGKRNAHQLAAVSFQFLTFFMNSAVPKLDEGMDLFLQEHLARFNEDMRDAVTDRADEIADACRKLLTQWYRRERKCPHDFYLKMFHNEGHFYRRLNRFDMVLVDEGQDLSPVVLDALAHCHRRVVVVGDTHQQIYSFRYAIDAMSRCEFDEARELTMSFRFGPKIAKIASVFIQEAKGRKTFTIRGNPQIQSSVAVDTGRPRPHKSKRVAILSRTNLTLFEKALDLVSTQTPFSLEGNVGAVLGRILDIYRLSTLDHNEIRDPFIRTFNTIDSLEKYASDLDDFQISSMIRVVRDYAHMLPEAVFEMMRISKSNSAHTGPSVILSTVHGAKGQEYDRVYIAPDIADALSRKDTSAHPLPGDETNIAYVAFTRAIGALHLPAEFKDILTPRWQNALDRFEPVKKATASRGSKARRSQKKGRGSIRPQTRRPANKKTSTSRSEIRAVFRQGEKVKTSHGVGTVVQREGDRYLVDMEDKKFRLWEKAWAISSV